MNCPNCGHPLSPSELAFALAKITSEKRSKQSRINGTGGGRKPKLTDANIADIIHQRKHDIPVRVIAKRYGVAVSTVYNITRKEQK